MLFIFIAQAIPGNPFVLDYLRKFAAEHEGQVAGPVDVAYQVIMVKKLWFSTRIGKEPLIDQLFHFPQVRANGIKCNPQTLLNTRQHIISFLLVT
jgi:hypothetical protein